VLSFLPFIRSILREQYFTRKRWLVAKYSDISITCSQCGKKFIFSEDEQEFYRGKGYTPPLRCKQCRSARQQRSDACSKCGDTFIEGSPQYCAACFIDVQLEFEQKAQGLKNLLQEAESKLQVLEAEKTKIQTDASLGLRAVENEKNRVIEETRRQLAAAESEKTALAEMLAQKEKTLSGLEQRLDGIIREMQKGFKDKDMQRSEPMLNSLKAKIEALEMNQNSLKELLLKLIEKDSNHRVPNFLDNLKTLFRTDRRSPA
jgi:DNA repair exonuclease SbcCD ATPase subunit